MICLIAVPAGDTREVIEPEEMPPNNLQPIDSRIPLIEIQALNHRQQSQHNISEVSTAASENQITQEPGQSLTYSPIPLHEQHQEAEVDEATKIHQPDSEPTVANGVCNSLPEMPTPLVTSSHEQEEQIGNDPVLF